MSTILNVCYIYIYIYIRFFSQIGTCAVFSCSDFPSLLKYGQCFRCCVKKGIFQGHTAIRMQILHKSIPSLFTHWCCLCYRLMWQEWHRWKRQVISSTTTYASAWSAVQFCFPLSHFQCLEQPAILCGWFQLSMHLLRSTHIPYFRKTFGKKKV